MNPIVPVEVHCSSLTESADAVEIAVAPTTRRASVAAESESVFSY
ncbi:hypothetical protein LACR_0153 [Lactococcus cremoris subsp. cremoris SK11]|uniref:Uncharacterized protein n=1 Tax=Lactococcus lactis subsp. cremoris (strain SK11) TaxID=272622 RepID=Q032U9_LACLS|nr:hypothetical protein LACR_0153 [Lactococcus cremoris subsp. cremoris SK11]